VKTILQQTDKLIERQDTLTISTDFSVGFTQSSGNISLTGSITNFHIGKAGQIQDTQLSESSFPLSFSGKLTDRNLFLNFSNPEAKPGPSNLCTDSLRTMLSGVQRDIFVLPLQLELGQSWQDSVSSMTCSGSLPVAVNTVRTYKVLGESIIAGVQALVIERDERILAKSQGPLGQHLIILDARGTGKGTIYADKLSGILLAIKARNQLDLSIQSSGRIQHFIQTSEETTTKKLRD